jgi:hypothetical protein
LWSFHTCALGSLNKFTPPLYSHAPLPPPFLYSVWGFHCAVFKCTHAACYNPLPLSVSLPFPFPSPINPTSGCHVHVPFGGGSDWVLNSGLCTCKAGALPLDPYLKSTMLWLFCRWGVENYLPGMVSNLDPLNLSLSSS